MSWFDTTLSPSGDDDDIPANCSLIIPFGKRNTSGTQFEFEPGWEGIPTNFVVNTFVFCVTIFAFALLRKKAWNKKSTQLSRTHKGWLQFIYGDRESHGRRQVLKIHQSEHHTHDLTREPNLLTPPKHSTSHQNGTTETISKNVQNHTAEQELENVVSSSSHQSSNGSAISGPADTANQDRFSSKGSVKKRYEPLTDDVESQGSRPTSTEARRNTRTRLERSLSIDSVTQMSRRLLDALSISDQDIQRQKGIDAVQYLVFQRYLIYFLSLLTVVCIVIVLPINLQGSLQEEAKPYARTTVSNLEASSNLLWTHAIISIALLPIGLAMMCHFSSIIKTDNEQVAKRTLFIRRIPKSQAKKDILVQFIQEKVPSARVEGIQFVYDAKNLKALHQNYINVVNAKYYCREYSDEYRERCEVRPYLFGHFGGLCCCCKCCPKVDGYRFYETQEHELEKDVEKEYRNTISSPVGSVFVTFQNERMAQNVYKYLRENQERACSYFQCFTCCFRFGAWLMNWCFNKRVDDLKSHQWLVSYAPSPEDVFWDNISVDYGMLWLRRILVHVWLFILFFFLTTPSILINTLNYIKLTDTLSSGLRHVSPLMTEYMSPLLLVIASQILPFLVIGTCQYLPYKTISEQNHSIMWKVYLFLVFMVLLLPSLGLTSAKALLERVATNDQSFRWQCLFPVDNGAFFINYVLQSALLGNAMELLRIPELFLYFFATLFYTRTPAEYEAARQQIVFDFAFGVRYPRILLIFCMVVSYSLSCPLIAPCGLLYMVLKHLVDRYNIYYVYTPSKINDRIHSTAIMFFHIGILMMQFQVFTFSFLRTGYSNVTGLSVVSVIAALILFSGHCFFHCFRNINHLTYNAASRRPNQKIEKSEFCACLYLPPVLAELTAHGIQSPPAELPKSPSNYGSISTSSGQSTAAKAANVAPSISNQLA